MAEHKMLAVEELPRGGQMLYRCRCSCGWTGPDQAADDFHPHAEAIVRAAQDFERHKAKAEPEPTP
jgi:hypothetical protein